MERHYEITKPDRMYVSGSMGVDFTRISTDIRQSKESKTIYLTIQPQKVKSERGYGMVEYSPVDGITIHITRTARMSKKLVEKIDFILEPHMERISRLFELKRTDLITSIIRDNLEGVVY